MQKTSTVLTSLLLAFGLILAAAVMSNTASAQESETPTPVTVTVDGESTEATNEDAAPVEATEESQQSVEQSEASNESFSFVAQPGDSYSKIARKAVQIFGIDNKVNLSGAQIVFVETNLTIAAGSPVLNEGQTVDISKEIVKQWVEKALALNEAQQAAWNVYVPYVDFNTNSVGE
jgi:hypothetical protein